MIKTQNFIILNVKITLNVNLIIFFRFKKNRTTFPSRLGKAIRFFVT